MEKPRRAPTSSMHRSQPVQTSYLTHIATKDASGDTSCDMCRLIEQRTVPTIHPGLSFEHVCVIENEFPYMNTDGRRVERHHMLVPRRHVSTASELNGDERRELNDIRDALLDDGLYDAAYTRSTHSPTSSVPLHLHTHLFVFGPKIKRQSFDPDSGRNDIEFEST